MVYLDPKCYYCIRVIAIQQNEQLSDDKITDKDFICRNHEKQLLDLLFHNIVSPSQTPKSQKQIKQKKLFN